MTNKKIIMILIASAIAGLIQYILLEEIPE